MKHTKILLSLLAVMLFLATNQLSGQMPELNFKYKRVERYAPIKTKDQLSKLREQGKRNNWTFQVGNTSVAKFVNRDILMITGAKLPAQSSLVPRAMTGTTAPSLNLNINPSASRYDLRNLGVVTAPKNQLRCGSCWAFCATACMETAQLIRNDLRRSEVDLSEQYVLSCSGAGSCSGGLPHNVFKHFDDNGRGAPEESSLGYSANDLACPSSPRYSTMKVENWGWVGATPRNATVSEMKNAIATYGAVESYIWVNTAFGLYTNGVINDDSRTGWGGWHCVQVIGWDDNLDAYLIKNSWGEGWGMNGYAWVKYDVLAMGRNAAYVVAKEQIRKIDLDGFWINVDKKTRGVTKFLVTNGTTRIQCYGSCSPRDCDWGTTALRQSNNKLYGVYDQGFAIKKISLRELSNNRVEMVVRANYRDRRRDRKSKYIFKKLSYEPNLIASFWKWK